MSGRRQVGEVWKPDPQQIRRERERSQLWSLTEAWKFAGQGVRAEFMNRFGLQQIEEQNSPEAPG
jgi:hypothetical protein